MSSLRLAALAAAVCGCSPPPNSLQGSLSSLVDLTFQKVVVEVNPSLLLIQYQETPKGGGLAIPFQLQMTPPAGKALADGAVFDLTGVDASGNPLVNCTRAVANDPRSQLPPIKIGALTLTSDFAVGQVASGNFHILFAAGGDVGEGTTVDGTFSTTAVAPSTQGSNP